jgi:hypothetical protein
MKAKISAIASESSWIVIIRWRILIRRTKKGSRNRGTNRRQSFDRIKKFRELSRNCLGTVWDDFRHIYETLSDQCRGRRCFSFFDKSTTGQKGTSSFPQRRSSIEKASSDRAKVENPILFLNSEEWFRIYLFEQDVMRDSSWGYCERQIKWCKFENPLCISAEISRGGVGMSIYFIYIVSSENFFWFCKTTNLMKDWLGYKFWINMFWCIMTSIQNQFPIQPLHLDSCTLDF